jgi:hypothetical protein
MPDGQRHPAAAHGSEFPGSPFTICRKVGAATQNLPSDLDKSAPRSARSPLYVAVHARSWAGRRQGRNCAQVLPRFDDADRCQLQRDVVQRGRNR